MASGTQAVVCDSCSRLISAADATCPFCGALRIGSRASSRLRDWVRDRRLTDVLFATTILAFLASLALSGPGIFDTERGFFWILGPTYEVVGFLGALEPHAVVREGEVWRLLTAAFLHAGVLHVGFNMAWLRQAGPFLEEEFGPFRFATVYLGSGIAGNLAALAWGQGAIGASGAIFGLYGAGFALGKRRGGTFGQLLRGTFGQWALYGVAFTLLFAGHISVPGHLGGLAGGFLLGWALTPRVRRSSTAFVEPPWATLLGALLLALVPVSFAAAVAKGLLAPSAAALSFVAGGDGPERFERWPLRARPLDDMGATGWIVELPVATSGFVVRSNGFRALEGFGAGVGILLEIRERDLEPAQWIHERLESEGVEKPETAADGSAEVMVPGAHGATRTFHARQLQPGLQAMVMVLGDPTGRLAGRIARTIRRS